uniref:Uncharacterized protein n=1 Tax=Roseihalotalea indica TaxID=2867963 RepID=A0AA49JD34_9BACT|nr:hypothetical protein K4G66_28515 [Tunicatimonas sp. TK19036]
MMVIVGAHSLLGTHLSKKLNKENFNYLALAASASDITQLEKQQEIQYWQLVDVDALPKWVAENAEELEFMFWCLADQSLPENQLFTTLWQQCYQHQIPFIFATRDQQIQDWASSQERYPFFWAGLQTGQLYGPGEEHFKEVSEVYKVIQNQLEDVSATNEETDQLHFTYVQDVVELIYFFVRHRQHSGFYDLPQQQADVSLLQNLVIQVKNQDEAPAATPFSSQSRQEIGRLKEIGYKGHFHSLPEGIYSVVTNYLAAQRYI